MRVRGLITLASPAAEPERVEEEEEEVQAQTQQGHSTQQQNGLRRRVTEKETIKSSLSCTITVGFIV